MTHSSAGGSARPSQDLVHPPEIDNAGRHLTQSPPGPAQAGCADAGVSCCYSPTWYAQRCFAQVVITSHASFSPLMPSRCSAPDGTNDELASPAFRQQHNILPTLAKLRTAILTLMKLVVLVVGRRGHLPTSRLRFCVPKASNLRDAIATCLLYACRWLDQQPAPSAKCTTGTYDASVTAADLIQACSDGTIGPYSDCVTEGCVEVPVRKLSLAAGLGPYRQPSGNSLFYRHVKTPCITRPVLTLACTWPLPSCVICLNVVQRIMHLCMRVCRLCQACNFACNRLRTVQPLHAVGRLSRPDLLL